MRALLAITGRELRERWMLVWAALVVGLLPHLPYMPPVASTRAVAGAIIGPAAFVIALLTGGSVIARDLAEGRLSFFFSRPIPWWAIAGGKLLAAALLTIGATAVAAAPVLLLSEGLSGYARWMGSLLVNGGLALLALLALGLIGLGHAASIVYRSRSPWAVLDVGLFALSIAGGVTLFRALVRWGLWADPPPTSRFWLLVLLLLAVVTLAPAASQVALGRSDLRRGHQVLSTTLWSGVLVLFALAGGFLARELALTPADFESRVVFSAGSDGRYVALSGFQGPQSGGRIATFLLDTTSGRFVRKPHPGSLRFAADGRHAVWMEGLPFWRVQVEEIQLARLDGESPVVETVELDSPLPREPLLDLALATPADRVAVVQTYTLSVQELPSGHTLSRTAAADGEWLAAAFQPDGRLRAFRRVRAVAAGRGRETLPGYVEVVELAGGVPSSRVRFEAVGNAVLLSAADRDRVLLYEPSAPRVVSLHDTRSGQRLRTFTGDPGWTIEDALSLENGRTAVIESDRAKSRLRLATDDRPDRLVELPDGLAVLGEELPGGILAVGIRPPITGSDRDRRGDTVLVALDTGEVVRREPGLLPALRQGRFLPGAHSRVASSLFVSETEELLRLDGAMGDRRVILPAAVR